MPRAGNQPSAPQAAGEADDRIQPLFIPRLHKSDTQTRLKHSAPPDPKNTKLKAVRPRCCQTLQPARPNPLPGKPLQLILRPVDRLLDRLPRHKLGDHRRDQPPVPRLHPKVRRPGRTGNEILRIMPRPDRIIEHRALRRLNLGPILKSDIDRYGGISYPATAVVSASICSRAPRYASNSRAAPLFCANDHSPKKYGRIGTSRPAGPRGLGIVQRCAAMAGASRFAPPGRRRFQSSRLYPISAAGCSTRRRNPPCPPAKTASSVSHTSAPLGHSEIDRDITFGIHQIGAKPPNVRPTSGSSRSSLRSQTQTGSPPYGTLRPPSTGSHTSTRPRSRASPHARETISGCRYVPDRAAC